MLCIRQVLQRQQIWNLLVLQASTAMLHTHTYSMNTPCTLHRWWRPSELSGTWSWQETGANTHWRLGWCYALMTYDLLNATILWDIESVGGTRNVPSEANCLCKARRDWSRRLSSFMVLSIWLALRELLLQTLWGENKSTEWVSRSVLNLNDVTAKHTPLKHPLETANLPDFEPTYRDGRAPPHSHWSKQC